MWLGGQSRKKPQGNRWEKISKRYRHTRSYLILISPGKSVCLIKIKTNLRVSAGKFSEGIYRIQEFQLTSVLNAVAIWHEASFHSVSPHRRGSHLTHYALKIPPSRIMLLQCFLQLRPLLVRHWHAAPIRREPQTFSGPASNFFFQITLEKDSGVPVLCELSLQVFA